ncbi:MAG: DNA repair protein RecO [Candidatus Paceibacterota bacterium]|jgi:DNA repair protein RecO
MHHIYHTEGLILSSSDFGEAGKRYAIFTRNLGMIYARATGVRKMPSKLRFVLQDFSCVKVDLVQGKNFWRITSASKTNKLELLSKNRDKLQVFGNIAKLLIRLLAAAEPNEKLFADLLQGLLILENSKTAEDRRNVEVIIVLRALADLGYIGGGDMLENFVKSPLEEELVYKISKSRSEVLRHINQALKASNL